MLFSAANGRVGTVGEDSVEYRGGRIELNFGELRLGTQEFAVGCKEVEVGSHQLAERRNFFGRQIAVNKLHYGIMCTGFFHRPAKTTFVLKCELNAPKTAFDVVLLPFVEETFVF
jgi:hypothetical protein